MGEWWEVSVRNEALIFYRDRYPVSREKLSRLLSEAVGEVFPLPPDGPILYGFGGAHPELGTLLAVVPDEPLSQGFPSEVAEAEISPHLSEEEVEAIRADPAYIVLHHSGESSNLLTDRKLMLRVARILMREGGFALFDMLSRRFWPLDLIRVETSFAADLPLDALYKVEAVWLDERETYTWTHTHGLSEVGAKDIDIVGMYWEDWERGICDLINALVDAVMRGLISQEDDYEVFKPGGLVRVVPMEEFIRNAPRKYTSDLVENEPHVSNHVVVCEPDDPAKPPVPSRCFRRPAPDDFIISMSPELTSLLIKRAKGTYFLLCWLFQQLRGSDVAFLVKAGFSPAGTCEDDSLEHLWFEASNIAKDKIEGRLLNEPFGNIPVQKGKSYRFPARLITDWIVFTEFGRISPAELFPICSLKSQGKLRF